MPGYIMAQIKLRWGNDNLSRFNEAMLTLVDLFVAEGLTLQSGCLTQYGGQLYEVWNIWRVDDAQHMNRARAGIRAKDAYHKAHAILAEVVESEQLRYVEELPYASGQGSLQQQSPAEPTA